MTSRQNGQISNHSLGKSKRRWLVVMILITCKLVIINLFISPYQWNYVKPLSGGGGVGPFKNHTGHSFLGQSDFMISKCEISQGHVYMLTHILYAIKQLSYWDKWW